MALKRKSAKAQKVDINEVAKLFATYDAETKAAKKKAEEQKKVLLEYAASHPEKFEGNRLKFECGVYVEIRGRLKAVHDDIEDLDWVESVAATEHADILVLKLDAKAVHRAEASGDEKIKGLLDKVNARAEELETMAVYAKGK